MLKIELHTALIYLLNLAFWRTYFVNMKMYSSRYLIAAIQVKINWIFLIKIERTFSYKTVNFILFIYVSMRNVGMILNFKCKCRKLTSHSGNVQYHTSSLFITITMNFHIFQHGWLIMKLCKWGFHGYLAWSLNYVRQENF